MLLLPVAAVGSATVRGAPTHTTQSTAVASLGIALAVLIYAFARVRAGRWAHADASQPAERVQLNVFLLVALLGAALLAHLLARSAIVTTGLLLCAGQIAIALLVRPWQKLSLHASSAAYATALWWPEHLAVLILALLTVGVGWSRLVLGRHTRVEVLAGVAVGATAGLTFQLLLPQYGA